MNINLCFFNEHFRDTMDKTDVDFFCPGSR